MTRGAFSRRHWTRWLLVFGLWTVLGLSFASQFYLSNLRLGRPVSWWRAVNYALCDWYVFALLSVPVVWLARRFRVDRHSWTSSIPLHLGASVVFSVLYVLLRVWVGQLEDAFSREGLAFTETFQPLLLKVFHFNLLIYWVILAVAHAFDLYREARERELKTSELERHLAQARLQALQMQLNPHFLFNTLHAISALMHKDVEAADRMIARLSDLLRYALESTGAQRVSLKQELAFLDRYLEIEQTRFGDRLVVRRQIDPLTLAAQVPNLILQPLVENAIHHGIEPHAHRGEVTLSSRREGMLLHLEVRDNGTGFPAGAQAPEEGVGLSNTRARLEELYGKRSLMEFRQGEPSGLVVHLAIPWDVEEKARPTAIETASFYENSHLSCG